ncbi:MAG: PKD-like family lipoprotein, partial [Pseudobacter sp.]|uniref:PKD-like family lipoprotein n=1 Tax=Pseudobacter sp. TaxID=2045420 RepID=UPI003F802E54
MMENIKNAGVSVFTVLMLFISCTKYDQGYTYNKIDDVKISTDVANGRYTVVINDTLKINPIITESSPGKDEYTYEWRLLEQITPRFWVISESRELKAKIDLPAAIYYLGFKMTNKRTGQIYTYQGMVTVISPYNAGYYVTSNMGNQGMLSFVRASDDKVFHSVPEDVNNSNTYPGHALHADNIGSLLYYFTDQGTYRFTANDFVENGRNETVIDGAKTFDHAPVAIVDGVSSWDVFVVGDGDLHAGAGATTASLYGNDLLLSPFSSRYVGDYSLYSGVFLTSSVTMFYDNKHKRFMLCPSLRRELNVASATPTAVFDMADVKMTMVHS